MLETDERYFECPNCGWAISFSYSEGKYVSFCPYCQNRLEIDKEEFENEENDSLEKYFEFEE